MRRSGQLQPDDFLDGYRIDSLVAHGPSATLYRATDCQTGNAVAMKVPRLDFWHGAFRFGSTCLEANIARRFNHPGIVRILSDVGSRYLVMEWAEGQTLRRLLSDHGCPPLSQTIRIALNICDALVHVHERGVAHLDLKPENVIVDFDGEIKLIDFGNARELRGNRLFRAWRKGTGTLDYASPEQLKRKPADHRSDIYSLGLILYEMLTGEVPFTGVNCALAATLRAEVPPLPPSELNRAIPEPMDSIACRALSLNPRARQQAARYIYDELAGLSCVPEGELVASI
jgi:serine/threonine protein kinase